MNINYCKQFYNLTPSYHHAEILSELALGMEQAWPLGSVSPRNGRNNNSMLNFNRNTVNNEVTKQNRKPKDKNPCQFVHFRIFPSKVNLTNFHR